MIWLTWRQHRTELLMLAGLLALIVAALVVTGVQIHGIADRLHIASCQADLSVPTCQNGMNEFFTRYAQYNQLRSALPFLNLFPAFAGILIGVPLLAREFEQGTQRLAWTQSVPRLRWLRARLTLLLGIAITFSVVLTAVLTWWNTPFVAVFGRFELPSYDFTGVVPLAYATVGVALGASLGAVLRRSIPAVALTLLGYAALWMVLDNVLRWRLVPPVTKYFAALDGPTLSHQDWSIAQGFVDRSGHIVSDDTINALCQGAGSGLQCAADHGWRWYVVYHPASDFWALQGVEAALLFALAAALVALTLWWTRTRAG
ncbi:MAG TPA: hypothetical protein VGR57_07095 [Ktedonobacterales bacterium]|nr:hypothetical protein [Ktedonobacterales bacterium]